MSFNTIYIVLMLYYYVKSFFFIIIFGVVTREYFLKL